MSIQREKLKAIADVIREYTDENLIIPNEFPQKIKNLVDTKYNQGLKDGYNTFWNGYLQDGKRQYFDHAFMYWSDSDFKPNHNMRPVSANYMFNRFNDYSRKIIDLEMLLNAQGVTIDFSKCLDLVQTFSTSYISRVGVIDTTNASNLKGTFANANNLITIDELILKDNGSQTFQDVFMGCKSLVNIKISGTIGKNGFYITSPNLSTDSITNIINCLSDSGGEIGLGSNIYKLTAEHKKTAAEKGWKITT